MSSAEQCRGNPVRQRRANSLRHLIKLHGVHPWISNFYVEEEKYLYSTSLCAASSICDGGLDYWREFPNSTRICRRCVRCLFSPYIQSLSSFFLLCVAFFFGVCRTDFDFTFLLFPIFFPSFLSPFSSSLPLDGLDFTLSVRFELPLGFQVCQLGDNRHNGRSLSLCEEKKDDFFFDNKDEMRLEKSKSWINISLRFQLFGSFFGPFVCSFRSTSDLSSHRTTRERQSSQQLICSLLRGLFSRCQSNLIFYNQFSEWEWVREREKKSGSENNMKCVFGYIWKKSNWTQRAHGEDWELSELCVWEVFSHPVGCRCVEHHICGSTVYFMRSFIIFARQTTRSWKLTRCSNKNMNERVSPFSR